MRKNREGHLMSKTKRQCTNPKCRIIFKRTSKTVTLCNSCNSNRVKLCDKRGRILNGARSRAKVKGLECNISKEDIVIPEFCPILKFKLISSTEGPGGKKESPSLDRIDPSKGYVKNNVRVISHLANMMKSSANAEEMILFADWVNKFLVKN